MSIILYPSPNQPQFIDRVFAKLQVDFHRASSSEELVLLAKRSEVSCLVLIGFDVQTSLQLHATWKSVRATGSCIVLLPSESLLQRVQALAQGVTNCYVQPVSYVRVVMEVAKIEYEHVPEVTWHTAGPFSLNYVQKTLKVQGRSIRCTRAQFEILSKLLREPGRVFSRMELWDALYPHSDYPLANAVDVHISRLRKALPHSVRGCIGTRHGFGYFLHIPNLTEKLN